jgi:hypothetical protein
MKIDGQERMGLEDEEKLCKNVREPDAMSKGVEKASEARQLSRDLKSFKRQQNEKRAEGFCERSAKIKGPGEL